jgi:outer membrane biosynthesis protein TonB
VSFAGTALVHGLVGVLLFASRSHTPALPPVYKVRLLAAPEHVADARKAPEAVQREAGEQPAPPLKPKPLPKNAASRATPPPTDATRREAAPRTTPKTAPLPGEQPSTGSDPLTVSTEGVEFPYPEYLQNAITEIRRRWQRPSDATPLDAEVAFFVHRDGSISDLAFVKRSGNFAFDLEAEGAVEEAGRFKAFGPLPASWPSDVLYIRFFFTGRRQ